tara:strand:+ start:85 stop:756 length:672 start_codon:yes stop_codon:yes gene_type:complete
MPERVTREEKIVELAILKARETLEALRDGEDTKLDIVKLKRPKAKASKHGIKQDKVHANSGGEEFTSGKIKKAVSQGQIDRKAEELRSFAMITDRKIRVMIAKGVLSEEELKEINRLQGDIKEAEEWVTGYLKGKFGDSGSSDEKKSNQVTDKTNDPRDISRTYREGKAIVDNLRATHRDMRMLATEGIKSTLKDSVKLEADMRLLLDNLIQNKDTSNADKLR